MDQKINSVVEQNCPFDSSKNKQRKTTKNDVFFILWFADTISLTECAIAF